MIDGTDSPVQHLRRLSAELGVELLAKRDDLLPFPLGGNKVRKLTAELASLDAAPDLVISNGAIASNHCRTLALLAAEHGFRSHLVLHGDRDGETRALALLDATGATYDVVSDPADIAPTIDARHAKAAARGDRVHVVAGGCHTRAGAIAYRDAAVAVISAHRPAWVVVASGTGATHGGIAAGAAQLADRPRVVGVSVGRIAERGTAAVAEAARWAGADVDVDFRDAYLDGGYGRHTAATASVVALGWKNGLPLDHTYTGKAMAGLRDMVGTGEIAPGARVLFWHTGGLANYLLEGG
ncbi:1-aminocyclopropane-1-carboxylate deaminase/D-cysteine desulfhydrase [Cellulomonas sp. 179-A 9B4 NHS]|uniref:1-aminocyclopropane-1-carboxylate deaminase/D-cysteine desulfhydrase n=1 Tax=Cellulomonas sp. 179-A 9B4 NHS TaxID=3142379 RepID=UPI0039A1FF7E